MSTALIPDTTGFHQKLATLPIKAKISIFGIAAALILVGIATWANSGHSAAQAAIAPPQIDPMSMMANAKNLPSQESLTLKMWPDNGPPR
jgi:hypothetical protein